MKSKGIWTGMLSAAGVMILILDAKTAISGVSDGIAMCMQAVIPALFPFFILCPLVCSSLAGKKFKGLTFLSRLCRVPAGSEALLIMSFLGGYPTGAKNLYDAVRSGSLSPTDARRMLGFCNNAGPAFIFGMLGGLFPNPHYVWAIWIIHILSAILTGVVLPDSSVGKYQGAASTSLDLSKVFHQALLSMAYVCGWVILFRTVITFFNRWFFWLFPPRQIAIISGLLEITNGCLSLYNIDSVSVRFLISAVLISIGGLCVTMQTASVTREIGLGMYIPGKIIQSSISMLIAGILLVILPDPHPYGSLIVCWICALAVLAATLRILHKKSSSISKSFAV